MFLSPDAIEVEIGFPIDQIIEEEGAVKSYLLPSYDAVTALYVGKYEDMTPIYMEMMAEIKAKGKKFSGMSYEYYLSDEEIPPENQETILELPYC